MNPELLNDAVSLLCRLIATPSTSRDESAVADIMGGELARCGFQPRREANNVWAVAPGYVEGRPTLLLNAHLDTVRPVASWTRNPYGAGREGNRLYGLGANDCGGGLVSLLQAFRHLSFQEQPGYNIIYLASAEEEVSGKDGMERVLRCLPPVSVAIVGEPTGMQPAIAEKGLMVVDGYAKGVSGHAARREGLNAIYEALPDLLTLRDYRFERVSKLLGETLVQVTQVESGTQHNVVPDSLHFVVDVRTNELYTNEEAFALLDGATRSELRARSFRLHSSHIDPAHPLVAWLTAHGKQPFGSPTLSDQALMSFPSLKLGPGESSRSHTADEFVTVDELRDAIETYIAMLTSCPSIVFPKARK